MICSSPGCNPDSLLNQINQASLIPNYTKIAVPSNSWLDDYYSWLASSDCCRVFANDTSKFCASTYTDLASCISCPIKYKETEFNENRPVSEDFYKYLEFFLKDNPGLKCSKGGHAAYGDAVELVRDETSYKIGATYFMTYHTVGVTSTDFIESLKEANKMCANITRMMRDTAQLITSDKNVIDNIQVFPYRYI